jgi:hypothetical protein
MLHGQEKLFCQTFLQNGSNFTTKSTPLAQPQSELFQSRANTLLARTEYKVSRFTGAPLLTVNFRQPSHEFTFNVGIDLLF